MTEANKNNHDIDSKVSLIKEFIEIFVGIDQQIIELHQCSSDDFLGLNSDFKQYYRQSKLISENATQIFNELTKSESLDLIKSLEKLYKNFKQIQIEFSGLLNNSISSLRIIIELIDGLFLPVKNLNQDLLTLKVLIANLKISSSASKLNKIQGVDSVLAEFNEIINEFKICSFQNESNLSLLKEKVKNTLKEFEQIREKNLNDLEVILNNIHYGIIFFAEKHEEVSRQIPELSLQTESSSKSIAEIITNLQYHDIIRQKMEHVHTTHKKLLNELEQSANTDGDKNDLLVRIRDIANLQSAQLVYANKEYQKAIEVITEKFIAIGADLTTIASMCQDINSSQHNSDELHLHLLLEKLNDSTPVLDRFLLAGENFTSQIDNLNSEVSIATASTSKFNMSLNNLKTVTGSMINQFTSNSLDDDDITKTLLQIQGLYNDVEKFENVIQLAFKQIENTGNKLLPDIGHSLKKAKGDGLFGQASQLLSSITGQLNEKNNRIKDLLEDNLQTSKTVSLGVKDSISKVRYYDFFEKVIVNIIGEFNHIHQLLKDEEGLESANELDNLKGIYTMASEHIIHDKVTQGDIEGDINLFSDETESVNEDDDNLELF
jgi:hypothetical protein